MKGRQVALAAASVAALTVTLGVSGWKVHSASKVRLRGVWFLVNKTCNLFGLLQTLPGLPALHELHGQVIEAERLAFGDGVEVEDAKKQLWDIQTDGADAKGNRFTPLGRLLFSKDLTQRLMRRLRFAEFVQKQPPSAFAEPSKCIIIVGLPRTGSTLISRLLTSDPKSRCPRCERPSEASAAERGSGGG